MSQRQQQRREPRFQLCGKPRAGLVKFQPWDLRDALVYHLTYHHSLGLHLNHLVFLHVYLVAVLMLLYGVGALLGLVAPGGVPLLPATLAVALCAYALSLGGVRGAPYCGVVAALAWFATEQAPLLLQAFWGLQESQLPWVAAGVGFCLMLAAFMCQLAGHAVLELFQAPPDLMHGFFAAPVLEWLALLARLGLMPESVMGDVWQRVKAMRTVAARA